MKKSNITASIYGMQKGSSKYIGSKKKNKRIKRGK